MRSFGEERVDSTFADLRLENALQSTITRKGKPANPALSPSGLGCERGAAFKLMGATTEDELESYESGLPAAVGSFIHERIQTFLSSSDIWVDVKDYLNEHQELGLELAERQKHAGEVSLIFNGYRNGKKITPPFSFQCDGILNIDGETFILEIKSEAQRAFLERKAPNPKHQLQGLAYGFLYGVRKILWLYTSRESFGVQRKIYLQELEKPKIDAFETLCQKIGRAVEERNIKSLSKGKNCQWCPYKKQCSELV